MPFRTITQQGLKLASPNLVGIWYIHDSLLGMMYTIWHTSSLRHPSVAVNLGPKGQRSRSQG